MHSIYPGFLKSPSKNMLDTLLQIYENEQLNLPPVEAGMAKSCKGLCLRGLVGIRPGLNANNKTIQVLFLTAQGKKFLEENQPEFKPR